LISFTDKNTLLTEAKMPNLEIKNEPLGQTMMVTFAGSLDASTVTQLESELNPLVESHKGHFLFDLKELEYISSAGVGFFMQKNDELKKRNVNLAFSGLTPKVSRVFTVLNLHKHFKIFETKDKALEFLKA
jgi:anti-sigma B factor antagonist